MFDTVLWTHKVQSSPWLWNAQVLFLSILLTHNMLLPLALKDCCSCPLTYVGFSSQYSCYYSKLGVYTLTFPMNQLLLFSPQISPINLPPCFLSATQMWPHSWPFIVSSSVPILSCFILPKIKILQIVILLKLGCAFFLRRGSMWGDFILQMLLCIHICPVNGFCM